MIIVSRDEEELEKSSFGRTSRTLISRVERGEPGNQAGISTSKWILLQLSAILIDG